MHAQTNLQLYNQLLRAGWREADLWIVHAAYELALSIFAGQHRPNHKPFLAHVVGVAGLLAEEGGDAAVVAAGLLHSAYQFGEFGDGTRGMTDGKRRRLRQEVGAACEEIVARYASIDWSLAAITNLLPQPKLSSAEQAVFFVKLADVLEDHCDFGMHFAPQKKRNRIESNDDFRKAVIELAVALGHEHLAQRLAVALDDQNAPAIPEFLSGKDRRSFLVVPRSHTEKPSVRVNKVYHRWRAKILKHLVSARAAA